MDKEQLQDILNQVRNLNHMEYDKAERLKKKAAVLLGSSYSIDRIKFTSHFGFSSPDYNRQEFYRGKNELEAIIEAKMEVLTNRDEEIRKQKERLSSVPKILTAEIFENIVKNEDFETRTEKLRNELFTKKTELTKANDEIQSLKSEIKITKKFRIVKEIATVFLIIAGGFTAGSVVVGVKVDYDKRRLQEQVDQHKFTIDSLRKIGDSNSLKFKK